MNLYSWSCSLASYITFIEHLLYARHCSRCWKYKHEQNQNPIHLYVPTNSLPFSLPLTPVCTPHSVPTPSHLLLTGGSLMTTLEGSLSYLSSQQHLIPWTAPSFLNPLVFWDTTPFRFFPPSSPFPAPPYLIGPLHVGVPQGFVMGALLPLTSLPKESHLFQRLQLPSLCKWLPHLHLYFRLLFWGPG